MRSASRSSPATAFTLVELVVSLAIFAMLFAIALPSFVRFIAEQRLLDDARRLAEAIMVARAEAVKRNAHVVVCVSPTGVDCDATHWHQGWLMFEDRDGDADAGPDDPLIGRDGPAAEGVTMRGNRPVQSYTRFDFAGQARTVSGALQMGTFEVCKPGLRGYQVVLANSGRTRIVRMSTVCP
jgi:type IV fimbrial biogenesis protein FimT